MTKKFYITTPIYYVNDSPHIGHAYTSLACDALARFKRLDGYDVKFLTGTDEHGQKVAQAAEKAGKDPKAFVDEIAPRFQELCKLMNFSNDDFIRTTESRHKKSAQEFWKLIDKAGYIYLNKYSGWYSVRDEAYYAEDELINGKAPTGADVEWVEEESYFFKLSSFDDKLLDYFEKNKDFIAPESRRNEVISFIKSGLQDLSISRTRFSWGIPVPGDEKHVMYVWIDALANYLSAVGFPDEKYKEQWPADLHMVGKDILRFHAVYWPAMLMAAGIELPKRIFAHGWWTNEGQKMSKSVGNVIAPSALVNEFGLDQTRYFLLREFPFGQDGNFSRERLITVINSELANNIGNLCQRTLSFISKNCDAVKTKINVLEKVDKDILAELDILLKLGKIEEPGYLRAFIEAQKFDIVIERLTEVSRRANIYIDSEAPWKLKKENTERMETVLNVLTEVIKRLAILLQPFIPDSAAKILIQLGYSEDEVKEGIKFSELEKLLKPGTKLGALSPVFPRFVEDKKEAS